MSFGSLVLDLIEGVVENGIYHIHRSVYVQLSTEQLSDPQLFQAAVQELAMKNEKAKPKAA